MLPAWQATSCSAHVPWESSAFLGSITHRQSLCSDTKAVALTRDLLWNLSQSCSTRRKAQTHSASCLHTYPDLSEYLSPHLSICHHPKKRETVAKKKHVKDFFFCVLNKCRQKFYLWRGCVLQMPQHWLPICLIKTWHMQFRSKLTSVKTKTSMFSKSSTKSLPVVVVVFFYLSWSNISQNIRE